MYKVNKNKECYKAYHCDGRCPKNCVCPWVEEQKEASNRFMFEYWSSEQNRAEDPSGYQQFCENVKNGLYE